MMENHRDIFDRGIEVWNQWRTENPDITPDFSYQAFSPVQRQFNKSSHEILNLSGACFNGVGLQHSSFLNTNLSHADFTGADISHTRLIGADLSNADLSGLNLVGVDFTDAAMNNTNLIGADLSNCRSISHHQLEVALGDETTLLPTGMNMPQHWLQREEVQETVEQEIPVNDNPSIYDSEHDGLERMPVRSWLANPLALGSALLIVFGAVFMITDYVLASLNSTTKTATKPETTAEQPLPVTKKASLKKQNSLEVKKEKNKTKTADRSNPPEDVFDDDTDTEESQTNETVHSAYYERSTTTTVYRTEKRNNDGIDLTIDNNLDINTDVGDDLSEQLEAQQTADRKKRLRKQRRAAAGNLGSSSTINRPSQNIGNAAPSGGLLNGNVSGNLPSTGGLLGK